MTASTFTLTSDTYAVNLNMPNYGGIRFNKTNNIELLNFWSGEISVLDKDVQNNSLVLVGKEFVSSTVTMGDISSKVDDIFNIQNNSEEVTITNLETNLNHVYIISSFSIETSSEPWYYGFDYQMSLEYVRD